MNQYIKQYQKNDIETASQEQILIMLYNGAIQFLNLAKKAMEEKNIQEIHNNIIGAQKIIREFQATLDMENGGALAQRLYGLYSYLHKKLINANINKDMSDLEEVLNYMKDLRDTWVQAIQIAKKEQSSQNNDEYNGQTSSQDDSHDWSVGDE